MSELVVSGVRKAYGGQPVLCGVDLRVDRGSITAVLGASGCGKSTLLRIVAGFVRPEEGNVRIGHRTVERAGASGREHVPAQRRGVGYVPQEGALFPHLSVAENVVFGLPRPERSRARAVGLLDLAELPRALVDRHPHELSGGEQQRVALARALAPDPEVVLLDEPFSSLDSTLRASAGRTVARVLRSAGATAVLVTHDQGEALSLADQVAVMRRGIFVQSAPPAVVYGAPVDPETAVFVGGGAILPATVNCRTARTELGELAVDPPRDGRGSVQGAGRVLVRPEQLELADAASVRARVQEVGYHGAHVAVVLRLPSGAEVSAHGPATLPPKVGETVGVRVVGAVRAYGVERP